MISRFQIIKPRCMWLYWKHRNILRLYWTVLVDSGCSRPVGQPVTNSSLYRSCPVNIRTRGIKKPETCKIVLKNTLEQGRNSETRATGEFPFRFTSVFKFPYYESINFWFRLRLNSPETIIYVFPCFMLWLIFSFVFNRPRADSKMKKERKRGRGVRCPI